MGAMKEEMAISVEDVARDCLRHAKGNVDRAAGNMAKRVRADSDLFRAMFESLVDSACRDAVRGQVRTGRAAIVRAAMTAASDADRVVQLAAGNGLMYFALPIRGCPVLGQAVKAQIEEAAQFYERQQTDMRVKAVWLGLVAKKVGGGKTVGEAMTERDLAKLMQEAASV